MNERALNNLGMKPIKTMLTDIFGGWRLLPRGSEGGRPIEEEEEDFSSSLDLTDLMYKAMRFGYATEICHVVVGMDPQNSSRLAIMVGENSSDLFGLKSFFQALMELKPSEWTGYVDSIL